MSFQHWPAKDIMRGIQDAQLSRKLPIDLKMLICDMSIGFAVFCVGLREGDFDKNGIKNRRDIKCLVKKFSSEEPQKDDWICWACLDFLKKYKLNVWKHRVGLKSIYNVTNKPQRFERAHCSIKKNSLEIAKEDPELSKVKIPAVIKLRLGEFKVSLDTMNHPSYFRSKSLTFKSNTMARYPYVTTLR